jgi:hypothetical protein
MLILLPIPGKRVNTMSLIDPPYEAELIEQAMITPLTIETTNHDDKFDHMKITCKIDEDEVDTSAFGLIYTLSFLSFRDARPAGASEMDYQDKDAWWASDMLKCLRFQMGRLYLEADYERGRRMKTTIQITEDGKVMIETSGRGSSASRWISTIQCKKVLTVIQGNKD